MSEAFDAGAAARLALARWSARNREAETTAAVDQGEFDERAAILEFDGGHSRAEAERLARLELAEMRDRTDGE